MEKLIRLCIVDDHPGVRAAIRGLLANSKDIQIIGEGANGAEAIQLADKDRPDILLLDVELPVIRGDEVAKKVHETMPEVKILALSSYNDPMYILGMLENGAAGYITKDEAPNLLVGALHSIMQDQVKWISATVANQVSQIILANKVFTGRELEILRYIMLDTPDEEMCRLLQIDEGLLNRHISLLQEKFDASSREDLKIAAQGIISIESP